MSTKQQVTVLKVEFPAPPAALMTAIDTNLPPEAARASALRALIASATEYIKTNAKEAVVVQEKKKRYET